MDRRNFIGIAGSAAVVAAAGGSGWAAIDATKPSPAFVSACNLAAGETSYGAASLDASGQILWRIQLQARAHWTAVDPAASLCAIVDRKPGAAITLCDIRSGRTIRRLLAPDDRRFDGHAVFSVDGSLLFATESLAEGQSGNLGVYRPADGVRQGTLSTFGIEPHQVISSADHSHFIVANGGIVEGDAAPETDSCISVIDARFGALVLRGKLAVDLASLSLRHIALTARQEVLIGIQDQDTASDLRPLIGLMNRQGRIEMLESPDRILDRMQGYVGSVVVDSSGEIGAATSPRGGLAAFWRLADRHFIGAFDLPDGCGAAATAVAGHFMLTSGRGVRALASVNARGELSTATITQPKHDLPHWDNHMTAVRA